MRERKLRRATSDSAARMTGEVLGPVMICSLEH
jgi:hypothetical protein